MYRRRPRALEGTSNACRPGFLHLFRSLAGSFAMTARRFVTPIFLVLLVALVSCLQGAKAPQVTATRTLDLGAESEGGGGSKKAFGVVFAGPKGKTEDPSEVTIVFNRPMRPLELADGASPAPPERGQHQTEESSPPASIVNGAKETPKGAWRWMGTSALIFAPDPRLP